MNRQDYFLEWRPVETRSLQIPSIRSHTAGTVVNNDLIIFGGKGSSQFNEIWKFSSTKLIWEVIETNDIDIPLPRDGHTLTKVSSTQFYVYGGQGHPIGNKIYEKQTENGKAKCLSIRRLYDDLYCFDCTNLSWKLLPRRKICPNGRRGHTMLYVPSDIISKSCFVSRYGPVSSHGPGYLLLFGGSCVDQTSSVEKTNNDMWLYSLDTLEWEQIEYNGLPPPPLYGHCAEIIENYMIVVGGNISSPISQRKGSNLNEEGGFSNRNTISIFDLLTFQWSHRSVRSPPSSRFGLNLIGHSIARSPLASDEIWIFGGRRMDEENLSEDEILRERSLSARVLSFNLQSNELYAVRIRNSTRKSPESRLNQVFVQLNDVANLLSAAASEEQQGISQKRVPTFQEQPIIRLYGGSKLYSSGFCSGDVYDLFIVPCQTDVPTQLSSLSRAQSIIEQESSPASLIDPHQSSSSYREESDDDSSLTSNPRAGYHRLNLKTDSSTFLSAPKSGIEGKYFLLKTELSHSKSTFTTDLQPLQPSKVAQKPSSLSSPSSTSSLSPLRNSIYKDSHPHQLAPLDLPADYSRSSRKGENTSSPTKRSPTKRLKPLARDLSTQSIK